MIDRKDALRQVHVIVLRYLDGHEPFDAAAQRLADILRETSYFEVIFLLYSESLLLLRDRRRDHLRGIELVQGARRITGV